MRVPRLSEINPPAGKALGTAMTINARCCFLVLAAAFAIGTPATAQVVSREQDISGLRLGQRVLVDDGSCPAGQIKEVRGARMTPSGIQRTRTCVPRLAPSRK